MAFAKKTWKDRIAEFPTRRRLTKEDNTSELVTVAREEGTLSQEGDAFSAENMNDLENRIDAEFTAVNGKLIVPDYGSAVEITLPYTADNNGYIVVANMKPVSLKIGGLLVYTDGTSTTQYAERGMFPIAKDDVLSLSTGEVYTLHFIPAK